MPIHPLTGKHMPYDSPLNYENKTNLPTKGGEKGPKNHPLGGGQTKTAKNGKGTKKEMNY